MDQIEDVELEDQFAVWGDYLYVGLVFVGVVGRNDQSDLFVLFDSFKSDLQSLDESFSAEEVFGGSMRFDDLGAIDEIYILEANDVHSRLDRGSSAFSESVSDHVIGNEDFLNAF